MRSNRIRIIRAHALTYSHAGVLADFEIELIREVHGRCLGQGSTRSITPAEWQVIDDATEAMSRAPRQDFTAAGLAA